MVQDGVVGLNNGGGHLGGGVDTELELGLLAVVDRQTLQQESTETGTGTTTEGVEDEEALETSTVVGELADTVEDLRSIDLLANGVVATGVVVGSILLAGDHLLRVEELAVGTGADLVDDVGLEIDVDGTGNVLALAWWGVLGMGFPRRGNMKKKINFHTSLREEGAEAVVGVGLLALLSEVSIGLSTLLVPPQGNRGTAARVDIGRPPRV